MYDRNDVPPFAFTPSPLGSTKSYFSIDILLVLFYHYFKSKVAIRSASVNWLYDFIGDPDRLFNPNKNQKLPWTGIRFDKNKSDNCGFTDEAKPFMKDDYDYFLSGRNQPLRFSHFVQIVLSGKHDTDRYSEFALHVSKYWKPAKPPASFPKDLE